MAISPKGIIKKYRFTFAYDRTCIARLYLFGSVVVD